MLDFYLYMYYKGVDRIPPHKRNYQIYNRNIQHAGAISVVLVTC